MQDGYMALIGLGAVGTPLAHLLYQHYRKGFVLLADEKHGVKLRNKTININGQEFAPWVVTKREELAKPIQAVFICVKNYDLVTTCRCLKEIIDDSTIILPMQNGIYSYHYLSEVFPNHVVLECFAKGPNTKITCTGFIYENPGVYHIGTSIEKHREKAQIIYRMLQSAGINCCWDDDIKHAIWKKLMLNVAGNAMTALTEIDYGMFKNSYEAQKICRIVMQEYKSVAATEDVLITEGDIEDVMNYFISYKGSKRTSMLEDVIHGRETENEYIAGFIRRLAKENGINTPFISVLYSLMKIKEDVYLGRLST